ncbi:MAG: hypothetical protein QNJ40_20735 [Xanthomonadales bacterium]|nr:hypothetical protein [Xanthomonadales bacterium]
MIAALLATAIAAALQLWWRRKATIARLSGDEDEYLLRAHDPDPYRPILFLRMPLFTMVIRLLRGDDRTATAERARWAMMVTGMVSVALTVYGAVQAAGSIGGLIATVVLIGLPERMILNQHIWPDVPLSAVIAWLTLLLLGPLTGDTVVLSGFIIALAVLIRIEQLVLIPAAGLALASEVQMDLASWFDLSWPSMAVLAVWAARNGMRYGLWLPDTTPAFNLAVMRQELHGDARRPVSELVRATVDEWRHSPGLWKQCAREVLSSPVLVARKLLVRTWSMLGPDTFVSQRLLPRQTGAYADSPVWVKAWLKVSWPLTVAALLAGLIAGSALPAAIYPTVAVFLASVVVHSRSRYRLVCFPGVALWLALAWTGELQRLPLAIGLAVVFAVLLIRFEIRREEAS